MEVREQSLVNFGCPRSAGAAGQSQHPAQTLSKHFELKRKIFPPNISPFDLFLQDQTGAKRSQSADSQSSSDEHRRWLQMNANAPAVYVWDVQTSELLLLLLITMLNIAALNGTAHRTSLETGRLHVPDIHLEKSQQKTFFFFKSQKAQTLNELNKTVQLFFSFDRQNQKKKKKKAYSNASITTVASTLISSLASHLASDVSYLSSSGVFQRLHAAACLHVLRS